MKNPNEQPNTEAKISLRERLEQWKQKKNKQTPRKPIPNPDKPVKFEEMLRDNKPLPNQPKSTMKRLSSQSPSCTTSVRKLSDASDLDRMTFHVNPKLSESHRKDLERSLNFTNVKKTSQTPKPFKAPNTSFFTRSITMGDSRPGTCQKLSHKEENFGGKGSKGSALRFKDGSLVCKNPFEGLNLGRSMSLRSNDKKTSLREAKRNFNEPAPVSKFDVSEEMFWERKPVQMEREVDQFRMLCEDEEDVKRFESFLPEDQHLEVALQTPRKLPEVSAGGISMEKPRGNVDEFLWSSNIELEDEEIVETKEPEKSVEPVEHYAQEQEAFVMENKEENEQNIVAEDTRMNEEIEEINEEINKEVNKEVNEETHINEEIQEKVHAELNENVHREVNFEMNEEVQEEVHVEINENVHPEVNMEMNEEVEEKVNEEVNEIKTNEETQEEVHAEINENVHPEINKEMNKEEVHEEPIVQAQNQQEEEVPKETETVENTQESIEKEGEVKLDNEREREEMIERRLEDLTNTREDSSNLIFEPSNDRIEFGQEANKGSSRTASTTPVKHLDSFDTSSSLNNEEKPEIAQNNENDETSSLPINLELTQDHKENNEEDIIVNTTEIEHKEQEITQNTAILETKEQEEIIPSTAMLEEKDDPETITPPVQEIPQYNPYSHSEQSIREETLEMKEEAPIEEYKSTVETREIPPQMTQSMTKSQAKKRKRSEIEVLFEQASAFHGKESLKKVHLTNPNGREKAFATPHEKIKIELPQRSKGKASTNKKTTVNESPAPAVSASKMIDEFGSELIFSLVNVKGKQGVEQQVTPVRRSMRLGSVSKSQVPFLSSSKQNMNLSFSGGFSVSKGTMKFIDDILKAPSNDIADIIRAVDEGTSRIKELTKGKKGLVSCSKSSANKCSIPMFKDLE